MSVSEFSEIREDMPVLVRGAEDIYWVGFADRNAGFSNNPYLILDGDYGVLIDPGSRAPEHFNIVRGKVEKVTDLKKIKMIIVQHQDPDLCAAIPLFEPLISGDAQLIAPRRTAPFMRYYDISLPVKPVDDGDELELPSGRKLVFRHTPYVHFAGSMVTYDAKTQTLFSSDIFGGFSLNWSLYAKTHYFEAFKAFTEPYIGSEKALKSALKKVKALDLKRICPQHGSIIDERIPQFLEAAESIKVGTWIDDTDMTGSSQVSCADGDSDECKSRIRELVLSLMERGFGYFGMARTIQLMGDAGISVSAGQVVNFSGEPIGCVEKLVSELRKTDNPIIEITVRFILSQYPGLVSL